MKRLGLLLLWLLCVVAALVSLVWMLLAVIAGSDRAWRIAIGFDQTANAATGGDEDETISSRCYWHQERLPYRWLRRVIDFAAVRVGEPDHCQMSFKRELEKARWRVESINEGARHAG